MTDELKPCLAHPCDGAMEANLYDASLTCSKCQFQVADESEYSALVAGRQAAIDAALESGADEIRNGMDDKFYAARAAEIVTRRIGTNPLAERDARIAELERERDRAIQQHERCAEKLFNAERQRDMLSEAAKAALHYMRLHKYADQAWADDLEAAIAAAMTPNAQVAGLSVSEGEETMERDLRAEGWGPEDCYPETAEVSKSELSDLLANGFFPMESAPKDGRDIQIVFRHFNWRYADKEDRGEWQQLCTAYWTTFNNGGWVWNGLCGVPICWRPLANAPSYFRGNEVGIAEGLEMAALYHDAIAEQNEKSATWHENGSPSNGAAMAVVSHKKHAGKLRAMKPNLTA